LFLKALTVKRFLSLDSEADSGGKKKMSVLFFAGINKEIARIENYFDG